eukprot:CAMPEP_0184478478 /NCGR_PEP_ID=MMETSP0113_2-20130426/495_1 /TAXON_ID=91329 /ORGANISM="Norrisiella sphaerica, Strain BC52" /LENGTH=341 /DNA_ID=CAMNT_0026856287 /DNA_START=172 /DNA_END=1197 /DNA_ORIENTATION=+
MELDHSASSDSKDPKACSCAEDSKKGMVDLEMLTCSLCLGLVTEPITVPCGHTFCRVCLYLAMQRSKKKCPNCRAVCHVDPSTHSVNVMLSNIAQKSFPELYAERLKEMKKETEKFENTLPIFFYNNCLFPGCLLHLHLFEQRYRHMINRCVSSNRKFIYLPSFSDYKANKGDVGLMAHVDECEFLPDGRALLKATIQQRVKVTNSWVEEGTQGLHYCNMERYDEEDKEVDEGEYEAIVKIAQSFLSRIPGLQEQIVHHIGEQPSHADATRWSFWFAAMVTMISRAGDRATALLKTKKTMDRLQRSKRIFLQIVARTAFQNPREQNCDADPPAAESSVNAS